MSIVLVTGAGHVVTNRHVADPWWREGEETPWSRAGWRPVREATFVAFPGRRKTFAAVRVAGAEEQAILLERMGSGNLPDILEEAGE